MGVGLSIGTTSLISNAIGEKKDKQGSFFLSQSILLSIVTATFVTLLGIFVGPYVIFAMNDSLVLLNLSMEYLNIIFLGSIFIFIQMSVNSSLTAIGDTKSGRNILIFSFFLNIIPQAIGFLIPFFLDKTISRSLIK